MVFRARIDKLFSVFVYFFILIIGAGTIPLAFLIKEGAPVTALLLSFVFLITTCFLLWILFSNTYIFHVNFLLLKSGPFLTRIPYKDITKVSPARNISIKLKISSSRNTLEVFNTISALKSARLSPKNKKDFISELKNRNPNIQIVSE